MQTYVHAWLSAPRNDSLREAIAAQALRYRTSPARGEAAIDHMWDDHHWELLALAGMQRHQLHPAIPLLLSRLAFCVCVVSHQAGVGHKLLQRAQAWCLRAPAGTGVGSGVQTSGLVKRVWRAVPCCSLWAAVHRHTAAEGGGGWSGRQDALHPYMRTLGKTGPET